MKNRLLFIALPLLLSGCYIAPFTPEQLSSDLTRHYTGRTANQFLYDHKHSEVKAESRDYENIYYWSSQRPAGSAKTGVYHMADGNYQLVDNRSPAASDLSYYCGLKIYTDKRNLIQKVVVTDDSMGSMSASHCSELFYWD